MAKQTTKVSKTQERDSKGAARRAPARVAATAAQGGDGSAESPPILGASAAAQNALLRAQPNAFWHEVGIFPAALERIRPADTLRDDAGAIFRKLGIGNLRLLCEQSRLPKPEDAGDTALTAILLKSTDIPTVIHLREFMRRRTQWLDSVFERALPRRLRSGLDVDLNELSSRRKEILKPFTKLVLLYRDDPKWIAEVYHQAEWYARNSVFEYRTDDALPRNLKRLLAANIKALGTAIGKALGRGLRVLGVRELLDDTIVCSFLREYAKVVKPNFEQTYTVHHACGLLLFGIAPAQRRVIIKCGNRSVATVIVTELQNLLKTEFRLIKNDVFSEFTGEDLRQRFLGGFSTQHGLDVTAAVFRRCMLQGRPQLALAAGTYQTSLRDALVAVRDQRLADVFGPADIESITVSFRGRTALVKAEILKEGAVGFVFDNSGWEPAVQVEFERAFLDTFGIPVNRLLDPSQTALGTEGVFAHLLGITSEDEMQSYQDDCFDDLIERGIIVRHSTRARVCRNGICDQYGHIVSDETQQVCRRCDEELHDQPVESIERSVDGIARMVGDVLHGADAWDLGAARELDGHWYHPLTKPCESGREEMICVVFHDRLRTDAKQTFKRTGLPLLVVHGSFPGRQLFVDDEGIAHVSLAHLLAAQRDAETVTTCDEECRSVIKSLLLRHDDRIHQAASLSRDRLVAGTEDMDGDAYENDVFNVLRSLFSYTYRLGRKGKVEPDGYVCLPDYVTESLRSVGSWNWSYDAKLSNKIAGYGFKIEEHRKVVQYIRKLTKNRRALFGVNQRPRAHVIISNKLAEEKMRRGADHVFGPEGVGEEGRDIRFVLMQQEFLLALHEGVRQNADAIRRRRPFLERHLIELLEATPVGGYAVLGRPDAEELIQDVLACQEIETNIDPVKLKQSLHDEPRKRAKRAAN